MLNRIGCLALIIGLFAHVAIAQDDCALEPRLQAFGGGRVTADSVNVRDFPGTNGARTGRLSAGDEFVVNSSAQCIEGLYWYPISTLNPETPLDGYIAEGAEGEYFVEPIVLVPTPSPVFELPPPSTPVPPIAAPSLPPVTYATVAEPSDLAFVTWEWLDNIGLYGEVLPGQAPLPDPFTIAPPDEYAGDMPSLPVDLSAVAFVTDARLSGDELARLGQNGFVVTAQGLEQFDEAYGGRNGWNPYDGYSAFVTTDTSLHSFYLVFENLLTYLEQESLYPQLSNLVARAYRAAEQQAVEAEGTPLEAQARAVAVYYAVPLSLLYPQPDETVLLRVFQPDPVAVTTLPGVDELVATVESADPSILEEAQPLIDAVLAAEGQDAVPFLEDTIEDFGIYRPRGHYTTSALYERYFRAVTWLGRITFRSAVASETQEALLALRALQSDPVAVESRQQITDALEFLIGPVDNLGPEDYAALAEDVLGGDLTLDSIADDDLIAEFQARLEALPPPAINTAVLPDGAAEEQLDEIGRGFRLLGQRFTIDANILQQVIDPYITLRTIPTALDVPAALGLDTAYVLSQEAGAAQFPDYEPQMIMLRQEVSDLSAQAWLGNIYSGWLWTLQPFWARDADAYPPLMNTDAWIRHDLQTGLSSYTELKHATILYTAQPMGGRGGGGELPLTYGYVEPNPLVFARVAIMSEALYLGMLEQDLVLPGEDFSQATYLSRTHEILHQISILSTYLADMAERELTGEGLTEQDHFFIQYAFGSFLSGIRDDIQVMQAGPPKPVALVTDIASNGVTGEVLQVAVGGVDYLYVVVPTPNGLQLARGGVYSYYEFVNQGGQRMTDEEWRAAVAGGNVPPRPEWISAFFSE
jgi:hypothetical protein